jgi:hypothetical protein
MRHLCDFCSFDLLEILLLPCGVVLSALLGSLVPPPSGPDQCTPCRIGTRLSAVPIAVVTPAAQEEHLPAPGADHEA